MKNKYYKDFNKRELEIGYISMTNELIGKPKWISNIFDFVWEEFVQGVFGFDGATFVEERYTHTIFEVASFIHDWLNHTGYVGYQVDALFVEVMKELDYNKKMINKRKLFMIFTFINVWIHKIDSKKAYLGDINYKDFIIRHS